MKTTSAPHIVLAGIALLLLAGAPAMAGDDPVKQSSGQAKLDGIVNLMRVVGGLEMPDLTGLISPENMGMLSNNQSRIHGNEANFLSGNEAEITCMSGNKVSIFSNLRLLSGVTVNINVTIPNEDAKAAKGKKHGEGRKAKKSKKGKRTKKAKK